MPRSGSALVPCDAHLARAGVSSGALSPFTRVLVGQRRVVGSIESRLRTCGSRNRRTPPPACKPRHCRCFIRPWPWGRYFAAAPKRGCMGSYQKKMRRTPPLTKYTDERLQKPRRASVLAYQLARPYLCNVYSEQFEESALALPGCA